MDADVDDVGEVEDEDEDGDEDEVDDEDGDLQARLLGALLCPEQAGEATALVQLRVLRENQCFRSRGVSTIDENLKLLRI